MENGLWAFISKRKKPQLFLQQGEEKLWGFSMPHSLERERLSFVIHCCCGAILGTLTRIPAKQHCTPS